MRVALVHYWLLGARGGEKVLEAICRIFPEADIFTLFYDPEAVSPLIRSRNVRASFLNPFRRFYRSLLPLMPVALEDFDLRAYDLVISSESGPAKGVLTSSANPGTTKETLTRNVASGDAFSVFIDNLSVGTAADYSIAVTIQ